ncbi:hypothetical protein NXW53_12185 [Bacteroides ovatus]|nr:hypothetical protein [Bacteroides ovatus]
MKIVIAFLMAVLTLGIRFFTGGKAGKSRQDSDGGSAYHPL